MKELTDSERLEIAMGMLTDEQIEEYAVICCALETTPCVDIDCTECQLTKEQKHERDCPFI